MPFAILLQWIYNNGMEISTTPKYVTPEDFKTYWGIDLSEELAPPRTPNSFLRDVEDRVLNYISLQSWISIRKRLERHCLSDFQMDSLCKAILQQANYEFYNGTQTLNSGIDPERGKIVDRSDLNRATICQDADDTLQTAGLIVRKMAGYW